MVAKLIRIWLIAGVILVVASGLAFSAGESEGAAGEAAPSADGKTTIVYQNYHSAEAASRAVIEAMVELFEQEHPNIEVELLPLPYEQTLQQTVISASSGTMAYVVQLVPLWTPPLVELGALEPLDSYFSTSFFEEIPRAAYESGVIDGTTYTLPGLLNIVTVWAWKPLLEEAGLEPVVPDTWDEFKEASRKISELGADIYGFAARTNNTQNSAFWMFPVIWGHGGQFVDDQGNIVLDQGTGYADALDWYHTIVATGQSPNSLGVREIRNVFVQGKIGFIFDVSTVPGIFRSISEQGEAIDDDIIVGLLPEAPDGNRYGIGNDNIYGIAASSDSKQEAATFIEFMTSDPEAVRIYYERLGAFPTRKSLYDAPFYQSQPYFSEIAAMAEFATSLPSKSTEFGNALDIMANAMQEAILGGDTIEISRETAEAVRDVYGE